MADKEKKEAVVPDGGWGWMVVVGSCLTHFFVVSLARSFGVFYVDVRDMYDSSAAATAWIVALFNTVRMGFGPVAAMLVDRFSARWVVFAGSIVLAVGCAMGYFATSVFYLYISFGLVAGIGGGMVYASAYIIVGEYFDKRKGKAMGLSTLGSGLGSVALPPLIAVLLETYSLKGALLLFGALELHNCVSAALYRPVEHIINYTNKIAETARKLSVASSERKPSVSDVHKSEPQHYMSVESPSVNKQAQNGSESINYNNNKIEEYTESNNIAKKESNSSSSECFARYGAVMTNWKFLLYGWQIICMEACIQAFFTFLPDFAIENGYNKDVSSVLLSIVGGADLVGRLVVGVVMDLRVIRYKVGRRHFHSLLGIGMGLFALFTGFMNTYVGLVIMGVGWGFVQGGFHGQRTTVISGIVPDNQLSGATGFVILYQGIGNLFGPAVAGWLKDLSGTYRYSYLFIGLLLTSACGLFLVEGLCYRLCKRTSSRVKAVQITAVASSLAGPANYTHTDHKHKDQEPVQGLSISVYI